MLSRDYDSDCKFAKARMNSICLMGEKTEKDCVVSAVLRQGHWSECAQVKIFACEGYLWPITRPGKVVMHDLCQLSESGCLWEYEYYQDRASVWIRAWDCRVNCVAWVLNLQAFCLQSDLYTVEDGSVLRNPSRKITENPTVDLSSEFKKVFSTNDVCACVAALEMTIK